MKRSSSGRIVTRMAPMIMPEVEPMPPSISITTNFVPLSVVKVVGATYCMTQV